MAPPAHWTKMDSPVKPANDEEAGRDGGCACINPTTVTLRLDRRVHISARSLDDHGFAGQAGE